jgi:glucan-binding YG repeat protein
MNPTPRLRWVKRNEKVILNGEKFDNWQKVLQQWYAYDIEYPMTKGEWRDVPVEAE